MRYLAVLLLFAGSASAMPVVPNFRSGTMTSRTETKTSMTEVIRSMDYSTGYTYSASGKNVKVEGSDILPGTTPTTTQTVSGVTSTWTGLDLEQKPTWSIVTPGKAFQFVESYTGPGLTNVTDIERTIQTESVTDTLSVFGS